MNRLLVVVDMQNDFVDGSLGTREAKEIVSKVAEKIKSYEASGDPISFTMDTHDVDYLNTREGRALPVIHCVKGTSGWELCKEVQSAAHMEQCRVYEKDTFGSDKYAMALAQGVYQGIETVELVGLCTDICVIANALLTRTFLPDAQVIVDAACCAGVTPSSHQNALEAMKMCQIEIR